MTDAPRTRRPETTLIAAGRPAHVPGSPVNVPLVLTSTFYATPPGQDAGPVYSRSDGTATWEALEEVLGELEGGSALTFGSGMAAVAAVLDTLHAGAVVVLPSDCYHGVGALVEDGASLGRWTVRRVEVTDTAAVTAAVQGADLLWVESPTNPMMEVADLPALCGAGHAAGALVAVDNTFATPLLQRPLSLGADVVVHSATKFLGGHADLLLGATISNDDALTARLHTRRALGGATPGALEAFLALRGIRTLGLRLAQGQRSAGVLAERLQQHPAVTRVRYPGLADDPGHDRAAAQMDGPGAVLSFELASAEAAEALCAAVRVLHPATSLGGVESTIERRAKYAGQEHVPAGLLRFSVGCEHVEDLWDDLSAALSG